MWSGFYDEAENVLHQPHKCYLRVGDEVRNSMWLKYGKRFPKIKAPTYRDHRKAAGSKDNKKATHPADDLKKAALQAFEQDQGRSN